jgi:hypothetical protein
VADAAADADAAEPSRLDLPATALLAVLAGVALCWTARAGAVELLVVVAVLQAALAAIWVPALRLPGRKGAVASATMASAASDVAVSVWPHGRLAPLVAVVGLAVPVLLALQLMRGAARVRVIDSLAGISLLLAAEIALPAILQIRHEFPLGSVGGETAFGVAAAAAGALAVGCIADLVGAPLRFDPDVPRGLSGVVASTGAGALIGYLSLRDAAQFIGGRGVFIGAAVGALVALLAVAVSFVECGAPQASTALVRRARPVTTALLPLFLVAPGALLLCIAIRA